MKIGKQDAPFQAICTSNPETIIVRGHDLAGELMGAVSFTDHIWLLIAGAMPTDAQRRLRDATRVASAEHGRGPSGQAARVTLAAAQAGIDAAAAAIVTRYRAERRAIPGFGHPLHKGRDPRAERLVAIAGRLGVAGIYTQAAHAVERCLPGIVGKPLVMNVSGAIPCTLLDAGFPLKALKGVPLLARTASLVAHLLEEQTRSIGFILSRGAAEAISYDGPAPAGFVPNEN